MTQDAVAAFYELRCRSETAPPLPTVKTIAEYLVGQMHYPTNLIRICTVMSRSHRQVCQGDYPDSWEENLVANLNYAKEVEPKVHDNFTVAHMVALMGHLHLIRAIPESHLDDTTSYGSSLLYVCALGSASPSRLPALQLLLERKPSLLTKCTENNVSPMYVAGENNNLDLVQVLYKAHPPLLHLLTTNRCTPLFGACFSGNLEVVKYYHSLDPTLIRQANFRGTSTMSIAAQRNQAHVMRWLHEQDPTLIHERTNGRVSCLHFACQLGSCEAVKFIVEQCPVLLQDQYHGLYPFEAACTHGHLNVVQYLYETVVSKEGLARHGNPMGRLRHAPYMIGSPENRRRVVAYLEEKLGESLVANDF